MLTFLIRTATYQSNSYPFVLMRLGRPFSRPNPHLEIVEVPGIEPVTYVGLLLIPSDGNVKPGGWVGAFRKE